MDDELYREYILEHYKHPHNWGSLPQVDAQAQDLNPLCGDELRVQLAFDADDHLTGIAFDGHGCAISQASASMISDEIKGMSTQQVLALDHEFVLDLLGIEISATRMKCALLALKVIKTAALTHAGETVADPA